MVNKNLSECLPILSACYDKTTGRRRRPVSSVLRKKYRKKVFEVPANPVNFKGEIFVRSKEGTIGKFRIYSPIEINK